MTTQPSSDAPRAGGMFPTDWDVLAPLLDRVLDAAPSERPALIAALSAGDTARRAALQQLIVECEQPVPLLDAPASDGFPSLAASDELVLPPVLGERYRTGAEIGQGGMARVFLAHDIKHGRDVAVKVIRPDVAASLGRDRFLREIAIAARLRHPNIVPLYDSGDADGSLYFVMPYENGPSLRARLLRDGPLPLGDAVSVLRDVARALKHAHAHGVVHRDIKPDNVMMSGDAAVVADFGVAKAVSAAQTASAAIFYTAPGTGIGTPAYMAPEQAAGDPGSDHRGDIYSFGCLAYELLTGRPPFTGVSAREVVVAHMSQVPVPIASLRTDVPERVGTLVMRCLEKEPDARPRDASALLDVLDAGVGLPAAVPAPVRARRWRLVALGALAIGVPMIYAFRGGSRSAPPPAQVSVSVLPFGNLGGDSALAPVAAALSDAVYSALPTEHGLVRRSRTGAYNFSNGADLHEVGRALNADFLVTGDMREEGGHWIITASLTKTADASEVWTQTFDVDPRQQLRIAERIATGATASLRRLYPSVLGTGTARCQTANPAAYRNYLLGQELLRRRGLSVREGATAFRNAITLDSMYACAYAGLSMALALYPHFQDTPPADVYQELTASARRALALDSSSAQAHVALGLAFQHLYDWTAAAAEYRAALKLDEEDVEAHVQYGRFLLFQGRTAAGLAEFQRARDVDPASALVLSWVSYAYFLLGQRDSALIISHQAQEGTVPNFTANALGALVHLHLGVRDSAVVYVRRMSRIPSPANAYVRAALGDTALSAPRFGPSRRGPSRQTNAAFTKLGLRDTSAALAALERATDEREIWPEMQPVSDPEFDDVRDTPRFRALMRRVGLPDSAAMVLGNRPVPWRRR